MGDDDDEPEFSSAMPLEEGDTFFFAPRPLRNLVKVDELESLSPILSSHIADLGMLILHYLHLNYIENVNSKCLGCFMTTIAYYISNS